MEILFFIKGIVVGFALAVPIGPIGILCIRETITMGRLHGLIIGLAGATADLLYSCVAAFGITAISNTIDHHRFWIRLTGGIFLLILGAITFQTLPRERKVAIKSREIVKSYIFTIFLTLTNPLTIFAFIAVFGILGVMHTTSFSNMAWLVTGVFAGSCIWFLLLSFGANYYGEKFSRFGLQWINRIAGILIVISGLIAIVSLL